MMSRKASGGEGSGAGVQRSSDNRQPRDKPPPFRGGAGDATRLPAPAQCVKEVPRAGAGETAAEVLLGSLA